MHTTEHAGTQRRRTSIPLLVPTITRQSWFFMIGSTLFAVGSAMSIWGFGSANTSNMLCFIGAWFFTTAGFFQLILSGKSTVPVDYAPGKMFRAEWLAAATQSFGTLMFNVSTTAALAAKTVKEEKSLVWSPDAGGSVAFLISATFVYVAYFRERNRVWEPSQPGWWSAQINMIGCIAFGISAGGAYVLSTGNAADSTLANWGTLIGAICFFLASLIALPKLPWNAKAASVEQVKPPQ